MQKLITAALAALCLAAPTGALAQLQLPGGAPPIAPGPRLPEGVTPNLGCTVDLAIASVSLYKYSRPGDVRVEFEIYNRGPGAWLSGTGQQSANLVVHNNNTGRDYTLSVPIGERRYARGARVARVVSTPIRDAFDPHEFGGTVRMSIAWDPDIRIDGNACNDDSNPANDTYELTTAQVWGFVSGAARSQTFRR